MTVRTVGRALAPGTHLTGRGMAVSKFSRDIPQRLRTTFAPVAPDAQFDDVLRRLANVLESRSGTLPADESARGARRDEASSRSGGTPAVAP